MSLPVPLFSLYFQLEALAFPSPIRPVNEKRVAELAKVFRTEGCHQCQYPIPKEATPEELLELEKLRQGNSPTSLLDSKVDCLKGQHRIAAGKQFLLGNERWWLVAVYPQLIVEQRRSIVEGTNYSTRYTMTTGFGKGLQHFAGSESAKIEFLLRSIPTFYANSVENNIRSKEHEEFDTVAPPHPPTTTRRVLKMLKEMSPMDKVGSL